MAEYFIPQKEAYPQGRGRREAGSSRLQWGHPASAAIARLTTNQVEETNPGSSSACTASGGDGQDERQQRSVCFYKSEVATLHMNM